MTPPPTGSARATGKRPEGPPEGGPVATAERKPRLPETAPATSPIGPAMAQGTERAGSDPGGDASPGGSPADHPGRTTPANTAATVGKEQSGSAANRSGESSPGGQAAARDGMSSGSPDRRAGKQGGSSARGAARKNTPAGKTGRTTGKPATPDDPPPSEPGSWEDLRGPWPSPTLIAALVTASVAAVVVTAGALVPVSPDARPGFTSWPWLALLALGPALLAVWFGARGRPGLAAGLVLGLAALAPGRFLLDLQFAVDGPLAVRPELYLADRFLSESATGPGFWLLLAGDVLGLVAGGLAWRAVRARDAEVGAEPESRRWRLLVPLLAVVAGVGVLMAPVSSDTGFLLARAAFEGPWPALGGYLLIAAALPLAASLALSAPSEHVARGTLAGLVAATVGVVVPPLLAGLFRADLHVSFGSVVAVLVVLAVLGLASSRLNVAEADVAEAGDLAGGARLPGLFWWRLTAGVLGLLTAVAAVVGTFAPQVAVSNGNAPAAAESPARWFLLVAAVLLAVAALGTLLPKTAAAVRPVLAVGWAAIVLAGTAVLNTALTATEAGNLAGFGGAAAGVTSAFTYDLGAGAAWTFAALVLAGLTSLAAVGAGVVEREDAGDVAQPSGSVLTPVVAGCVLAVAAFGLPVFSAPAYVVPGLLRDFDTPSWGLLTALLVTLGAAGLALRSRPRPAASLLVGAALLAGLHAAELPLVGGGIGGAQPATGFWLALAAAVAFLIAAAVRRRA